MSESKKYPILLVDDEPEILFSLKGLLRREFELHTAESGDEALEILDKHEIHVVMTDQRMPNMTGAQLMSRVKNESPDSIRIIFTGYADIKAVIDAVNNGGIHRYITKPWDPDELIELLHEATAVYAEILERNRLLSDLKEYVSKSREIANELLKQNVRFSIAPDEYMETGERLMQRLNEATQ
jgi:response regulator RpfG family c-di-GMP phosphodiesterase